MRSVCVTVRRTLRLTRISLKELRVFRDCFLLNLRLYFILTQVWVKSLEMELNSVGVEKPTVAAVTVDVAS